MSIIPRRLCTRPLPACPRRVVKLAKRPKNHLPKPPKLQAIAKSIPPPPPKMALTLKTCQNRQNYPEAQKEEEKAHPRGRGSRASPARRDVPGIHLHRRSGSRVFSMGQRNS